MENFCQNLIFHIDLVSATFLFFLFFFPIRSMRDLDIKQGLDSDPSFRSRSSRKHKNTVLTAILQTLKNPTAITYAPTVTRSVGNQTELTEDGSTLIACNQLSSSVKVPFSGFYGRRIRRRSMTDQRGSPRNPDLQRKPMSKHQRQDPQEAFR